MKEQQRNNKFLGYGILLSVMGIVFMFLYSGLQNDHINIIQTFSGWSNDATMLLTVGNFACIVLTFLYGTMFIKFGVKKSLIPVMLICAAGCIGLVFANGLKSSGGEGNYVVFFISLLVVRCACMMFQMAGFQLVASWFVRLRGRIMGIVTVGSPLFSVIGTAGMTTLIEKNFHGDYRPFYVGIAVIIVVVAVVVAIAMKDTPEDVGLYPDGAQHALKSEAGEEVKLRIKDILTSKKGWQMIISFGALTFIINACMGSMAVRYMSLGAGPHGEPIVWLEAVKWLSLGALLGIPMSYIFGWLDDKFGTIKASIILGLTELLPILGLMFQPEGGSVPLMILWGFGVACMTGGVPTLHPCIMAYAYGRKEYQSANRIIMAIQLIPSAVAAQIMVGFLGRGQAAIAYTMLLIVLVVGIITLISMLKMKDANAEDRDYASKQV